MRVLRSLTLVIIVAVAAAAQVIAKELPKASPESEGFSADRLKRIDTVMQGFVDSHSSAGMVTLMAREGKIVFSNVYGMADIEEKKPMTAETLFRIASMSKPITVVAALILYEEGRFLLTDPVSKYIPEFAHPMVIKPVDGQDIYSPYFGIVPAKKTLTVRNLFNHTSGFSYGIGPHAKMYADDNITVGLAPMQGTIGDMVKRLATKPLLFEPGERWEYGLSNDVLGYLVEVLSGQTLEQFCTERIFVPLGMKDTCFQVPPEKRSRLASRYARTRDGGLSKVPASEMIGGPTKYFSGGAGIISSAPDYLRFAQMLLNGGELDGVRILGRKTVELMSAVTNDSFYIWEGRDGVRSTHGDRYAFGVGVRTESDDLTPNGSYGWGGAFHTHFWIDPEEHVVGVFMSQLGGSDIRRQPRLFKDLVYQALEK